MFLKGTYCSLSPFQYSGKARYSRFHDDESLVSVLYLSGEEPMKVYRGDPAKVFRGDSMKPDFSAGRDM